MQSQFSNDAELMRDSQMSVKDQTGFEDMSGGDPHEHEYMSEAAIRAQHYVQYDHDPSMLDHSMQSDRDGNEKIKRARSTQKITRNRKITSCLQCRERKQKCDRQRPVCGNCDVGNSRGGMCTYVDTVEGAQEVLAGEGEKDAKRTKRSPSEDGSSRNKPVKGTSETSGNQRGSSISASLATRRLNLISATYDAGKNKSLDFDVRVRCARAAAIGSVLFGTPKTSAKDGSAQLYNPPAAVTSLKLPTIRELGPLLDTYRANVEWLCNVVVVDLNRSRFENFINWYHSNPQTLPADPPLVPLLLVILALAIQARRTTRNSSSFRQSKGKQQNKGDHLKIENDRSDLIPGGMPRSRAQTPHDEYVESCSSEKELLETAGRCIDALQIACPSNWASAFSAPLDLIRANLLRGLWHLSELHLQFAGSCFAVTLRLAHAAALNRDTRNWQSMGAEEAQARQNMFWNVAMFEVLHTDRVVQPSNILPDSYDTQFPDNHEALLGLYKRAGLIEPFVVEGRRSNFQAHPISRANFDFHLAKFQLTEVLIKGTSSSSSGKDNQNFAEAYENWKSNLPKSLGRVLERNELGVLGGAIDQESERAIVEEDPEEQTRYLQDSLLCMISLSVSIQIHRPQVDGTGQWRPPEGQAQRSLEVCIDSAQRLIWLIWSIVTRSPGPPYVLYNFCIFYCFQAAIVIAIQSALCGPTNNGNEVSTFAVLARPSLDKAVRTLDLIAGKAGLRFIAEQAQRYASTLREIDIAQQKSKIGEANRGSDSAHPPKINVLGNVPGYFIGVPPTIVAEGDGKKLGGQGYPNRASHATPSTSDRNDYTSFAAADASHTNGSVIDGDGTLSASANQFEEVAPHQSFGFDFNDLQVFATQAAAGANDLKLNAEMGVYVDRPFHEVYGLLNASGGGSTAAALSSHPRGLPTSHHSTGLDLLAAQVDHARSDPHWSPDRNNSNNNNNNNNLQGTFGVPASSDTWASSLAQQHNGQSSYNSILTWDKHDADHSHLLHQQQSHHQQAPDENHAPLPLQPASAPPVESMGKTFATDWGEWEKAVERLLHSEH
ncbi:hypothetical protein CBS101457_004424 [Exobasidium rhododendri]|nr:hypothetical protein CBS101457_004424 [Exobasidium rhododendri]